MNQFMLYQLTNKECTAISVCDAFFALLKLGITFRNDINFTTDVLSIQSAYDDVLVSQQLNSSLALHTKVIDNAMSKLFMSVLNANKLMITQDQPLHINAKLAASINICLEKQDVTVEYDSEVHINADMSWSANHNLALKSKQNIVFGHVVEIVNNGPGSLVLMAGVERESGMVIFNADAKIKCPNRGKVEIYYHPIGNGANKYLNVYPYHKYICPMTAVEKYMWINNIIDLQNLPYLFMNYALSKDIDASATRYWNKGKGFEPLGIKIKEEPWPFTGEFNGNGHTIFDLYINRCAEDSVGIFRLAAGGRYSYTGIYDLTVKNARICGDSYVGVIAGEAEYVKLSGIKIENANLNGTSMVGFLIGSASGLSINNISLINCSIKAEEVYGTLVEALRNSQVDHTCSDAGTECIGYSLYNCIKDRLLDMIDPLSVLGSISDFQRALNHKSSITCFSPGRLLRGIIEASLQHFEIFIHSNAVETLNAEELFHEFNSITYESGKLNAWWHAFLYGGQCFTTLFNSSFIDKFDSHHALESLQFRFRLGNSHTILTYMARFNASDVLDNFLSSKIFNKLQDNDKLKLYEMQNDNDLDMFDILLTDQNRNKLEIFLNCHACFGASSEGFAHLLISKINVYIESFVNQPVLGIFLNSDFVTNLDQHNKQQVISSLICPHCFIASADEVTPLNMDIVNDAAIFRAFVCSRAVLSLDRAFKMKLLGEYYFDFEAHDGCNV